LRWPKMFPQCSVDMFNDIMSHSVTDLRDSAISYLGSERKVAARKFEPFWLFQQYCTKAPESAKSYLQPGSGYGMANAIGLRCYLITAQRERDTTPLAFDDDFEFELTPARFLKNFVDTNSESVRDSDRERSWYFEPRAEGATEGSSKGYIHYGTYGFESNFVNSRTKKKQYRRQVDDVEEIPLFYEFWRPRDADYAFAVFQSFAGRSCVTLVTEKIEEAFRIANEGYTLKFKKLVPTDGTGSVYADAPVKQLRFIKRNASSDIADRYIGESSKPIDMELLLKARRKQSLGSFGSISRTLSRTERAGVIEYDGVEFGEAIASIHVGGKYRPVGIFGISSDTGVIDVTGDVKRGDDGHPLFESIEDQVKHILGDFNRTISSRTQ